MDVDGRLSCDEFVLAMHLCDMVRAGEKLPDALPQELVPPSLRRPSLVAMAQVVTSPKASSNVEALLMGSPVLSPTSADDGKMLPVSFEDKRKENFDKGIRTLLK